VSEVNEALSDLEHGNTLGALRLFFNHSQHIFPQLIQEINQLSASDLQQTLQLQFEQVLKRACHPAA
jgi:hypothetical protein